MRLQRASHSCARVHPASTRRYELHWPAAHVQCLASPTLYTLTKLPPPPAKPRLYPVPDAQTIYEFVENIWHKARLTPQSLVICLVYVDRLEARSDGVFLHARSWRPVVFASLLLASKVWHDISYWNSDFSTICPMFNLQNINRMERAILQLLQYNTIVSSSMYASYYFALRAAARQHEAITRRGRIQRNDADAGAPTGSARPAGTSENFRSKYYMAISVPGASRLHDRSAGFTQQPAPPAPAVPRDIPAGHISSQQSPSACGSTSVLSSSAQDSIDEQMNQQFTEYSTSM